MDQMGTQRFLHLFLLLLFFFFNLHSSRAQEMEHDRQKEHYYTPVNSTVAIIVVAILSTLVSMIFFSLYLRRCGEANNPIHPSNANHTRRDRSGLDKAVVESFPTMVYSEVKELKVGKSTLECAVCLSEFDDEETLQLLPKCNHVFHIDCIGMWLESHANCPVCRADLSDAPAQPPAHVAVTVDEVEVEGEREETRRVWSEEERERFTLRLPPELRDEVVSRRLDRSTTEIVRTKLGRSGRSFKREWTAKSDRWAFLGRTWSMKTSRGGRGGEEGESSASVMDKV